MCVCVTLFAYLQQRRGPATVPQVLDDGYVSAKAAVHRAALVTDQNPPVNAGPARVWDTDRQRPERHRQTQREQMEDLAQCNHQTTLLTS